MQFKHLSQSVRKAHLEACFHDAIRNLDRLHPDAHGVHGHERLAAYLNMQCAGLRHDFNDLAAKWAAEHGCHTPEAVADFIDARSAMVAVPTVFAKKATIDEK